jgi:DNA mismatch endonuclease (patch repair protein)
VEKPPKPYEDAERIKVPRFKEALGFYTTPQRSEAMAKIRGQHTRPEIMLRRALFGLGYRYRLNVRRLPGKPDIVLKKYKLAIFIDGEFWHGHNWEQRRLSIKSNRDFWIPKIERNMQRDREVNAQLLDLGWTVLRFWAAELRKDPYACLLRVLDQMGHKP